MTEAADVQKKTAPYRAGYSDGFGAGKDFAPKRYRLSIVHSIISDRYREQYTRGYKQGYFDGSTKTRAEELRSISRTQNRGRNESGGRGDD